MHDLGSKANARGGELDDEVLGISCLRPQRHVEGQGRGTSKSKKHQLISSANVVTIPDRKDSF